MRAAVFCVVTLLGCQRTAPSIPANKSIDTFETASLEYARSMELDFARPMTDGVRGGQRYRAIQIFERVCAAGDPRACIRGSTGYQGEIFEVHIKSNCERGHQLSCRYLAWKDWITDEPYPVSLTMAELRRGCEAGLRQECKALFAMSSLAEQRFGAEMSCWNAYHLCEEAAQSYLHHEPRDVLRARDLYEFVCQDNRSTVCFRLSQLYVRGVFPEPRPGRGADLVRYACNDDWPDEIRDPGCPARMTLTRDQAITP